MVSFHQQYLSGPSNPPLWFITLCPKNSQTSPKQKQKNAARLGTMQLSGPGPFHLLRKKKRESFFEAPKVGQLLNNRKFTLPETNILLMVQKSGRKKQLRLVVLSPLFTTGFSTIPFGFFAGFLNHQQNSTLKI